MTDGPLVPVGTLAKLFNLTDRRVQQLARDNVIPKATRGKYPLAPSIRGYVRYLQERAFSKELGTTDLHTEQVRLKRAQADAKEIEAAVKCGSAMWVDDVKDKLLEIGAILIRHLDAIPGRLVPKLPGAAAENCQILVNELRIIRQKTADDLVEFAGGLGAPPGGDHKAASAQNARPVG